MEKVASLNAQRAAHQSIQGNNSMQAGRNLYPSTTRIDLSSMRGSALPAVRGNQRRLDFRFAGLCLYVASQAFMVPLFPIGPWAVWPRLSDLAFVFLLISVVMAPTSNRFLPERSRKYVRVIYFLVACLFANFVIFSLLVPNLSALTPWRNESIGFGSVSLLYMVQFAVTAHIAAGIEITERRRVILTRIVTLTLVLAALSVFATYFSWISTDFLAPLLPKDLTSGAWYTYAAGIKTGQGVGTIAYNHGYTAIQLILLLGLVLQLRPTSKDMTSIAFIALTGAAVFVSGSRAGLVAFLIQAVLYVLAQYGAARFFLVGITALLPLSVMQLVGFGPDIVSELQPVIERQAAAFDPANPENLVGRTDIWGETISVFFSSDPINWVFGLGLGSALETGANAHSLLLQYLVEFGLLGIVVIGIAFIALLRSLWRASRHNASLLCATIALLVSSITQETFYPALAFGRFLGFFFVALVVTVNVVKSTSDISEAKG